MQQPRLHSILVLIAVLIAAIAAACESDKPKAAAPPVVVDASIMEDAGGTGGAAAPMCDANAPDKCAVCADDSGCATPTYTVNADGTVLSSCCALVWQQMVLPTRYSGEDANAYCMALTLAGTGWRLPTVAELRSLVRTDQTPKAPTIDRVAFPDTPSDGFWTASPDVASTGYKWYVSFFGGFADGNGTSSSYMVRCVR